TVVQGEVFRTIEGTCPKTSAVARRAPLQRLRRQRWHPTIWRIDEKRRLTECLGPAPGAIAATCLNARRLERVLDGLLVTCDPVRIFLIGQLGSTGKLFRALPWNATRAVAGPGSLQIRISPGRPADFPRTRRTRRLRCSARGLLRRTRIGEDQRNYKDAQKG